MEINWIMVGWIIDMIFNGLIWLLIVIIALPLMDITDKWTRKFIKLMDVVDKWTRFSWAYLLSLESFLN